MNFKTKNFEFVSESEYDISLKIIEERADFLKLLVHINFGEKLSPEPTVIKWEIPCVDIFSQWNANTWTNSRSLEPYWRGAHATSRSASWEPVQLHMNMVGQNRHTVILSDPLTPIKISSGIMEETANLVFKLTFFTQKISAISEYETELIIDTRDLPYYEVLADAKKYWEAQGFIPASFPEEAITPMYSTWYSYHQQLDRKTIVEELKLAKEYGMKTVIVDDGWQTLDNNRGYAFCGDWEPEKLTDIKELVEDVHALGMKYMMWYSVPFVGRSTKAWQKFDGKFLDKYDENQRWCVFDVRYPDVRDYLITLYENAIKDWKLDGLKLDFIDLLTLTKWSREPDDEMDFESLEDAICAFVKEAKERLLKLNPDVLIEFRQAYMGPIMSAYGNMIRVADCPADPIKNRVGSIDLRLTAGNTPVHSDMLMWHYDDKVESAALEIINILFCVPQISVLIEKLSDEHRKMLKFYLDLWMENRDTLLFGNLVAKNPEANYSIVSSEKDKDIVAVSYTKNVLETEKEFDKILFVNGSWDKELIVNNKCEPYEACVTIKDCMGNVLLEEECEIFDGYNVFDVYKSGVLEIKRI